MLNHACMPPPAAAAAGVVPIVVRPVNDQPVLLPPAGLSLLLVSQQPLANGSATQASFSGEEAAVQLS